MTIIGPAESEVIDDKPPRPAYKGGLGTAVRRALFKSPGRVIGLAIIVVFVILAIIGPWLYPSHLPVNAEDVYARPSWAHPLGTDFEGTDVLSLLIVGTRYVLLSAAVAGVITVALGTLLGLFAGYVRGLPDVLISRFTDFVLIIPGIPLLIIISVITHFTSAWMMGVILGITGWGGVARAVRSQCLSLRERPFVEASRGLGMSTTHVVLKEILPNIAPFVAMNALVAVIGSIYAQTALFFLGVLPQSVSNWGVMLNNAVNNAGAIGSTQSLAYLLAPLISILLLTLGIVLVLDAVDEIFNPRLR